MKGSGDIIPGPGGRCLLLVVVLVVFVVCLLFVSLLLLVLDIWLLFLLEFNTDVIITSQFMCFGCRICCVFACLCACLFCVL